eukprot:TRINITY_DN18508_c0_g1_i1.p1 TRINITY_DN18508_c0_g1~~TRINITY_DN18508_c0_g1_i1.p1  ORF type:complete len:605 (-),score=218.83 TRINITY_DN18508_c0_g1_i1:139-1905(-)
MASSQGRTIALLLLLLALLLLSKPLRAAFRESKSAVDVEDYEYDDEEDSENFFEGDEFSTGEGDDESDEFMDDPGEDEDVFDNSEEDMDEDLFPLDDGGDGYVIPVESEERMEKLLKENDNVMVKFYAPWCGHCQAMAADYKEAAAIMRAQGANVVFAKVDGTKLQKLTEGYGADSYPSLIFFGANKTDVVAYNGGRSSGEIVKFIRKRIGPNVYTLENLSDAEELLSNEEVFFLGYFDEFEGIDHDVFENFASEVEVVLAKTKVPEVAQLLNLEGEKLRPRFGLIKQQPEPVLEYDGLVETQSLRVFVERNRFPLLLLFSEKTASIIFGGEEPDKIQVLYFSTDAVYADVAEHLLQTAQEMRDQPLMFVRVNTSDEGASSDLLEFFGVQTSAENVVVAYRGSEEGEGTKYRLEKPFSATSLKSFCIQVLEGSLEPYLKSEPIPEQAVDSNGVTTVVGKSFDAIVYNASADVLLEVYAPWCGHCKALEPTYRKLGRRFRNVDSVVVAKMDGTLNEHPDVKVDGFPSIVFYPANSKKSPIVLGEQRSLREFTQIIRTHAAIPFTLERKKTRKPSEEDKDEDAATAHEEL